MSAEQKARTHPAHAVWRDVVRGPPVGDVDNARRQHRTGNVVDPRSIAVRAKGAKRVLGCPCHSSCHQRATVISIHAFVCRSASASKSSNVRDTKRS